MATMTEKDHGVLLPANQCRGGLDTIGIGLRRGKGRKRFAAPVSARCVNTSHGISSADG